MINQVQSTEFLKQDPNEQLHNFIIKHPFFSWCLEKDTVLSEGLLKVLASIFATLGEDAIPYLFSLQSNLTNEQAEFLKEQIEVAVNAASIQKYSYETIRLLGFGGTSFFDNPIDEIYISQREARERARGIYYDEKNRRKIEVNTFTRYALTRIHLVQSSLKEFFIYSTDGYYKKAEESLLKRLFREILDEYDDTMWSASFERNYMTALTSLVPIHLSVHEGSPNLINFTNGVLDIETNQFSDHSPAYCTVNQLPYEYQSEANCPKFIAFLNDIFEGDQQRVKLIQVLLGYLFLREVRIHKAFIFLGAGSNGKSVLAELITKLIGEFNVSNTPLSKLTGQFALQNISGKLANISTENEMKSQFNTQEFKKLTAGDMVEVEKKYQNAYSSHIRAKLIILLNNMMDSEDRSPGYYRRLQIIPFNKTYYELKEGQQPSPNVSYMNPTLLEELAEELSGIFNYALQGLQILKNNNFRLPVCDASEKALETYKRQQNPMELFVNECIDFSEDNKIKSSEITSYFEKWLGNYPDINCSNLSSNSIPALFLQEVVKRGWKVKRTKIQGYFYFSNIVFK